MVVIFANISSSHIIDIFSEIYCLQTVITHELLKVSTSGIFSLLIPNSFNMAYVECSLACVHPTDGGYSQMRFL